MVVLDALHWIQGHAAPDLAVRWNCKAAKCGSCSAEVNGRPSLMCKTRLSDFDLAEPITVEPMRAFPLIRDLVTDVSWNYEVNKTIEPFSPPARRAPARTGAGSRRTSSGSRNSASASSASCARTSATSCATTRPSAPFMGPRYLVRVAGLEMHPIDQADRRAYLKDGRRDRLLQHHEVLHRGLPGAHQDHRQRDHPAQGARRRRATTTRSSRPGGSSAASRPSGCAGSGPARASRRCRAASPADGRWPARSTPPTPTGDGGRSDRPIRPADAGHAGRRRAADLTAPAGGLGRPIPTAGRGSALIRTDGAARGNPGRPRPGPSCIDLDRPDARDPGAPAGRLDLRLPRGPDEQRRRVHGGRPRRSPWPPSSVRGRSGSSSTPTSSSSSSTAAGGSRTPSSSRSTARRSGPSVDFRAVDGRPRPAGPELRRRRAVQRGDRPGPGRRPGLGRPPAGPLRRVHAQAAPGPQGRGTAAG